MYPNHRKKKGENNILIGCFSLNNSEKQQQQKKNDFLLLLNVCEATKDGRLMRDRIGTDRKCLPRNFRYKPDESLRDSIFFCRHLGSKLEVTTDNNAPFIFVFLKYKSRSLARSQSIIDDAD